MDTVRIWSCLAVFCWALVGCGGASESTGSDRVRVVAGFYPLAEAARQVGGNRVQVDDLTPAGAEPHDLEMTTKERDRTEDADLVVVLGGGFQPAVETAARARSGETLTVGSASDDPHIWLDPHEMVRIVDRVEYALIGVDSDNARRYARNAGVYREQLDALDREYTQGLATCVRRTIVTAHDAFGRLARRYDLVAEPIAGISPDQEPDPKRLAELADLAERDGVTTVFTETLVSPKVARTLAKEAGGLLTAVLDPLESLSETQRTAGANYISVMKKNLQALRKALTCN